MTEKWIEKEAAIVSTQLINWRRDFHKYAESGWLEMRTTSKIAEALAQMGYEPVLGEKVCTREARMGLPDEDEMERHYLWALENGGCEKYLPYTRGGFTGAIAELDCGKGPVMVLRFDIDALGVCESKAKNHIPCKEGFASVTEGIMHACGHDGHAAIGLGTAQILMKHRNRFNGKIRLIFQPAEEGVRGAGSIVEGGWLDDADYAMAVHLFPGNGGRTCLSIIKEDIKATLATSKFDVRFLGKAAHAGAAPHEGKNAMLAAASAVLNLHAIPRYGNIPTQINVGRLTAGTGRNVICDRACLEAEVRGKTTEAKEYMESSAYRIIKAAAEMYDCETEIIQMGGTPSLENSGKMVKRVAELFEKHPDFDVKVSDISGGGSEDYACFAERVMKNGGGSIFISLLCECAAANHDVRFDFNEKAMIDGVIVFCSVVEEYLGRKQ